MIGAGVALPGALLPAAELGRRCVGRLQSWRTPRSGHEKTLTSLLPALAGANLIYGLGMLESGVTIDFAQLVLDAEFARMIKFCVRRIPVTDETLSVDDIAEVGPFSDFLSQDDTYSGMRGQSRSQLIDRRVREDWAGRGSTNVYERAVARGPPHTRDARAASRCRARTWRAKLRPPRSHACEAERDAPGCDARPSRAPEPLHLGAPCKHAASTGVD